MYLTLWNTISDSIYSWLWKSLNLRFKNEFDLANKKMNELQTRPLPVSFKLSDFSSLKESGGVWECPSFYTNTGGYKMCLWVHANGFGTGNNTHITVHLWNQISDENHRWCLLAFCDKNSKAEPSLLASIRNLIIIDSNARGLSAARHH